MKDFSDNISGGLREDTSFPVNALPEKCRQIAIRLVKSDNYVTDYLATAIISAAATAAGNSRRLRVNGNWVTSPSLYMVLVGRPGIGKTPPINIAYEALREADRQSLGEYYLAKEEYERRTHEGELAAQPRMRQTLVNDFTPEAFMAIHAHNLRGVGIVVDEVADLFRTINRYNASPFATQMLSMWSGEPVTLERASKHPISIDSPCVNLIGTTQTKVFGKFIASGNCMDNGMLDRMLVSFPANTEVQPLSATLASEGEAGVDAKAELADIIRRIAALRLSEPQTITWTDEAYAIFADRYYDYADEVNACDDDSLIDTRQAKVMTHIARLALVVQLLRYGCGEATLASVDHISAHAAISLSDYYEECYRRLMERTKIKEAADNVYDDPLYRQQFIDLLRGTQFTLVDALAAGEYVNASRSTVHRWLKSLRASGAIIKLGHAVYRVIQPPR